MVTNGKYMRRSLTLITKQNFLYNIRVCIVVYLVVNYSKMKMNFVIMLLFLPTVTSAASESISMLVLRGKQSNEQVISLKQVSSRRECTVRCLANTACVAANVIRRNDTVTCQMLSRSDAEDDLEDNSDAEYLYSE